MALHSMCQPGVSLSPRRVPQHGLVLELRLREPQREVRRVFLALVHRHSGAGPQVLLVQEGQPSVAGELADVEIDVAAGLVGEPVLLDAGDQVDHVLDVLRGPADDGWRQASQELEIVKEGAGVELRDLPDTAPLLAGALEHLVLALVGITGEVADVGDVHDVAHGVAEVFQGPPEEILEEVGAQVPDVGVVVHGRAAAIQADLARLDGHELLKLPPHRVPDHQIHDRTTSE